MCLAVRTSAVGIAAAEDVCCLTPGQRVCCQQPRAEPLPLPAPPGEDVGRGIDVDRPGIFRHAGVPQPRHVIPGRSPGHVSGNVLQGAVRGVAAEVADGLGAAGPQAGCLHAAAGLRAVVHGEGNDGHQVDVGAIMPGDDGMAGFVARGYLAPRDGAAAAANARRLAATLPPLPPGFPRGPA